MPRLAARQRGGAASRGRRGAVYAATPECKASTWRWLGPGRSAVRGAESRPARRWLGSSHIGGPADHLARGVQHAVMRPRCEAKKSCTVTTWTHTHTDTHPHDLDTRSAAPATAQKLTRSRTLRRKNSVRSARKLQLKCLRSAKRPTGTPRGPLAPAWRPGKGHADPFALRDSPRSTPAVGFACAARPHAADGKHVADVRFQPGCEPKAQPSPVCGAVRRAGSPLPVRAPAARVRVGDCGAAGLRGPWIRISTESKPRGPARKTKTLCTHHCQPARRTAWSPAKLCTPTTRSARPFASIHNTAGANSKPPCAAIPAVRRQEAPPHSPRHSRIGRPHENAKRT